MKKIITLLLLLTFNLGLNSLEAVVTVKPAEKDTLMSQIETSKADKQEKQTKKIERMLEKAQKKVARKAGKKKGAMDDGGLSSLDKNLRLAIIFGIAAVAASILAAIASAALWWLVTPLWIVALVFLILWLVQDN